VKFVDVGSRCGFVDLATELDPTAAVLETGKKEEAELSPNCCEGCTGAIDRLRAGDTPELLTWGAFALPLSTHERLGLHSVSESATREPEPVLPSARS
jgi:hypothetical protein